MQPIAITAGEPAGIGPDLCVLLAQQQRTQPWVVVADPELLQERANLLGLPLQTGVFSPDVPVICQQGALSVLPIRLPSKAHAGHLNAQHSPYVLQTLTLATKACMAGTFRALVTAPVHKGIINNAGIVFSGHTEYLAQLTKTKSVVMLLASEALKVALVTTHLPLKHVAAAITESRLTAVITTLHHQLKRYFALEQPRIAVCGLNPHAGENGHLGSEEQDVIVPTLTKLRAQGMHLQGPLPADTLFTAHHLEQADVVLAMYHDQGLPTLKYQSFGKAANITLGLPIIRTSVDHGTALDLAGTGRIDSGSLMKAIDYATTMHQNTLT